MRLELSSRHVDKTHARGGNSFLDCRISHWHGEHPVCNGDGASTLARSGIKKSHQSPELRRERSDF